MKKLKYALLFSSCLIFNAYASPPPIFNFYNFGIPFKATGGSTSTSTEDRFTFKGVSYDARSDYGLACDGISDDTAKMSTMVTAINASPYNSVKISFPGTCLVHWTNWLLTKPTIFEGIAGGGLKIASGDTTVSVPAASVSQNGFTLQSGSAVTTVNDLLCIHFTADGGI
jgi:hypothetical protein